MRKKIYAWHGVNEKGDRLKGKLSGQNKQYIQKMLKEQGILPIHIQTKLFFLSNNKKIKHREIILFTRHLATLIQSGVPLIHALDISAKSQSSLQFHDTIQAIKHNVSSGKTLHHSLAEWPKVFTRLYCYVISSGEYSGTLSIILKRLADHLEKTQALKRKLQKALAYPIFVTSISTLIALILLIKIIPQFALFFDSFGGKLPLFTQVILKISVMVQHNAIIALIIILLFSTLFIYLKNKSSRFRYALDVTILNTPFVGKLIKKAIVARITRTLATLLFSGTPLPEALKISAFIANNAKYHTAIPRIKHDVTTGHPLWGAMKKSGLFSNMVVQMIRIGEESGQVDNMLNHISDTTEEELDGLLSTLSTLIEPMLILILGMTIGSFVLAMYLPTFSLGSVT